MGHNIPQRYSNAGQVSSTPSNIEREWGRQWEQTLQRKRKQDENVNVKHKNEWEHEHKNEWQDENENTNTKTNVTQSQLLDRGIKTYVDWIKSVNM